MTGDLLVEYILTKIRFALDYDKTTKPPNLKSKLKYTKLLTSKLVESS